MLLPWFCAAEGPVRSLAQAVFCNLAGKFPAILETPHFRTFFAMCTQNSRLDAMRRKQTRILESYRPAGELSVAALLRQSANNRHDFVPTAVLETMQAEMEGTLATWYREDFGDLATPLDETPEEGKSEDFQKKILPWSESDKTAASSRRKQSIIVVATYVDKLWDPRGGET